MDNNLNTGFSEGQASVALHALGDAADERQEELEEYRSTPDKEDSDEGADSESPIFDSFYQLNGSKSIMEMTNFDIKEFSDLCNAVSDIFVTYFKKGHGKKTPHKPNGICFMTLNVLKHGGHWEFLAKMFCITPSSFKRLITKVIRAIYDFFYKKMVASVATRYHMSAVFEKGREFKNFPSARYATDVKFLQSFRPSGSMEEGKRYFSGKHKLCGFKVEVSVLSVGFAVMYSLHAPGFTSDVDMFYHMLEYHKELLTKDINEAGLVDIGPLIEEYPDCWGILMDKGYQGAAECARAIHSQKKPRHRKLTVEQERRGKRVASDRIIVENFFGRLYGLWNILSAKYRWSEDLYDEIFRLCLGLSNFYIKRHPLREEDLSFYQKIKNRRYAIGESTVNKRKATRAKYRSKRKRRTSMQLRDAYLSEDETQRPSP